MHGPTHNRGQTLDSLISRGLNISSIVIKDVVLSDHFCIFFDILISVQSMKRQCRKADRMWRKTKLEIHYSIYKDSLHAFNVELATARHTFFSNLVISNLNNTQTLFVTVERLTNPPSQIPSEMLSDSKCNEFASFFSEKINNIRKAIGTSSSYAKVTQIRPQFQKK